MPLRERFSAAFLAATFDFIGSLVFTRYDSCQFIKCNILIDDQTENLAFTACTIDVFVRPEQLHIVGAGLGKLQGTLKVQVYQGRARRSSCWMRRCAWGSARAHW